MGALPYTTLLVRTQVASRSRRSPGGILFASIESRYNPRMPMPLEVIGLGKSDVRFVWDEGVEDVWSAQDLRIRCTCALCQSEMTGERILDPASVPEDITVTHMEVVGNYGLSIHYSDGHTTGIYRFLLLYEDRRVAG